MPNGLYYFMFFLFVFLFIFDNEKNNVLFDDSV